MRILVSGAYGQLGSELKTLRSEYPEWDFLFTDVDSLDITDENAVNQFIAGKSIDFLINCAAYTAVDKAETDVVVATKVNTLAPGILAKVTKKYGIKLIHISTDYVFAGDACEPYSEEDKVNPQGVYGQTKLDGERNVQAQNPESIIIRTAWLYSVYGNNFVKTMLRVGRERGELGVVFDQVGSPTNAADLAAAVLGIIRLCEKDASAFVPGIYHFSNEGVASWYDFAVAIFEMAGVECKVNPLSSEQFPTPTKRPHYSVLNKSKIRNTFEVRIPYWRDSLKVCLQRLEKI
ncbi:dTDP-4-dehydrorhamnose reductase [Maribellus sp. CM-23]|uniref:dTDP-4-dehydrorhamnose reductase n=1 Tax=Maribellus sp. CM-23 TaxID=2781026 RepID=UPI001F3A38D8|nr:dTDP-4-dehydrorhamnose reductase [Maribellus sp. CM-23]MCE4564891.1 dTDP-4-dehydrorhamnose reductase [Maribellus sp. CM-23]